MRALFNSIFKRFFLSLVVLTLLGFSPIYAQEGMVSVVGSGDSNANIIYQNTDGTTYYSVFDCDENPVTSSAYYIQKNGTTWEIVNSSGNAIYNADFDTPKPPAAGWEEIGSGTAPTSLTGDVSNNPPSASNVSVAGTLEVGEELTGSYDYTDLNNDAQSGSTFKWYRSDDNSGTNKAAISGATSKTYTLTNDDLNKYISFEVTPNDGNNAGTSVESALQGPILVPFVVASIERQDPSDETVSAQSVTFRVTFQDKALNVTEDDFSLNSTVDGEIASVTEVNARTYDVLVNNLTNADGFLALQIKGVDGVSGTNDIQKANYDTTTKTISQTDDNDHLGHDKLGQTFTATTNNYLTAFTIFPKAGIHDFSGTADLKLYSGNEDEGGATLLSSQSISISDNTDAAGQTFVFEFPVQLTQGELYTILMDNFSGTGSRAFYSSTSGNYPDGRVIFTGNNSGHADFDLKIDIYEGALSAGDALLSDAPATNESYTMERFNYVPTATDVVISGVLAVGETLTATYTWQDGNPEDTESGSTYKWYRSDDALGTNKAAIAGATGTTYQFTNDDTDHYLSFEVTPSDGIATGDPVESNLYGKPDFQSLNSAVVSEISEPTDVVLDINASTSVGGTPDLNITYAISGGTDASLFDISASGELTFKASPSWDNPSDNDSNNIYELVVTASSDNDPTENTQGISIYVFPDAELVVNDYEQIGESLESEIGGAFGWAVSLSANAQIMAVGANKSNDVATEAGKVRIYERVGSTWQQLGSDINGEAQEDEFGTEVSLSANGKILAVGADKNDNNGLNTGYVRIFEYNGSDWQQLGNNIEGENVNDNFGISLDLAANGNIIAVGANGNDDAGDNYGQVKVFEYDGTSWQQLGESINGEAAGDESGKSVSLSWDGKTLAIGAPLNDGNGVSAGHARVFRYNGTTWQQLGGDLNGSGDYDKFGENIKLSADGKILAASKLRDGNGVRIYRFDGASWSQLGSDLTGFYNQINSLELNASGNILSAGSSITFSNNLKGQSKVFGYDGSNWVQMSSDIQGNLASLLGSGIAMSANGLTFAVGAFGGLGYVNSYELVIKPEATDVSVSGNYEVGATLTGSYTYSDGLNTPEYGTTFQWYRSDDDQASNKTAITGATNRTYTLTEDDLEKYISFEVTPGNSNYEGYPAESTPQLFTFEVPAFRYATDKAIGFNDGGYISLNGQSGLDAGDANDNFSIALWLKSTDTNAALFGEFVSGSSRTRNYLTITEGKLAFDQYDPSGGTTIFDTPINTGEWVHVVLVQESGTRKAYVNGVLESTTGSSEAYGGGSPNQFFIGFRGGSSNGSNFTGEMNEVAWWSKTLSASEVADLYQGIIDLNDADLIGYLSFNQSEDENIVADIGNADGVMADGMDAADRVAGVFDNDLVVDENLNDGQVISESLILSTTNPATYTLLDADGAPVIINDEGKLELTEDLNTVNAQYTIRFKVEIQGVEYESTLELEVQDNTSPTLVSATKDSESQITLTFSEPVQIVGADAANFTVEDGNDNSFCVLSLTDGIAEDNQLILGMDDLSSAVSTLTITYDPSTGSIGDLNSNNMVADATGVMITLNQAPTVSSVSITGTIIEGNELTGNYDYSDDENDDEVGTVFKWYRADAANGTNIEAIAGATNSTYTLAEEDHEKYLFFEVIPSDGNSNGVATRSGATYVQYPRITSVSIPQVVVNVDDNVTVTIRANQTGLSLQSGIVNGIAVTGFSDEGDGTYTATYTLKEDHTNRFANDDIPVSFTLVDDNGGVSNTYNDAISQMGDALRVLDVSSAPSVAYQNFEDDGDDWNYTEASETYDLSNVRTYFEVMPQHRNIEGNITSTDDRGPYIIYPQIVDDLVATYDYNSADAPASFNTVTGTSVFEPHASTLQDRLNFGVFMKDRLPYIYFLFDNAQEDPNFRLGGEAAFNVMQEVPWNGYNPIVFFEDQETVGDNANIDFADSLAYYADQGVLKTSFKWAPEANDGMIYGPVVNNLIIDFDSSSIDNRYALYGHLDTFDGTLRPHKTRTDSNEDSELSFELKQSGSAVLVNNPDDGEDIVASTSSLNSPANGSNFLDFYNESGVDIATTRTYTFDAVDLTAGDEKLLSFSYYAKNLSYPDSLFIQVSYNETPDWDSADEEIFLTESADSWTDFEMRIPGDKESIALRIVSKTDDEDDKVSFDHFRVVEIVDEIAPTLAITSSANPASGPFTATFTFSENVTGFDINDISVGNGEASNFNTTSASVYTATITPASDGEVTVDVAADVAEDWIGNANTAATQLSVINDQTAPAAPIVASISTDAGSSATDNLTNDQTLEISGTAEANASIEVFIGGNSIGNTTADGAGNWTFDHTGSTLTENTHSITAKATDAVGNESVESTALSVTIDITAPNVPTVGAVGDDNGSSNSDFITNDQSLVIGGLAEANSSVEVFIDNTSVGTTTTNGQGTYLLDYTATDLSEGEYSITAKATDEAGNTSSASTAQDVTIDLTAPTVTITSNANDPQSGAFTATFTFSEDISGFVEEDISVGNGVASNFNTTSAKIYTATITPSADGDVDIDVLANKATDAAGNGNTAASQLTVVNDETAPAAPIVASISTDAGSSATDNLTNDQTLEISGAAESNASIEVFIGGNSVGNTTADGSGNWTFDHTGSTLTENTHNITAKATDAAGNESAESTALDVTVDTSAPSVSSGTIVGKTYGLDEDVDVTYVFDEAVVVDETNGTPSVTIAMGGQNRVATYHSGSGTNTLVFRYTTVAGDLDGNGVSVLSISLNGGTIQDVAGNNANTSVSVAGVADVRVDTSAPYMSITSSSNAVSGAFTATFTFNEDVSGFDVSDISVGNGSAGSFNTTSAKIYTATITPSTEGSVTVNVAADKVQDTGGNGNTAASELRVVNDETSPTISITSSTDRTNGAFSATFTFSEDVSGFDVNDIAVGNGAASNFATISASIYSATITPVTDGGVTVDVAVGAAQDAAGNNNSAATQFSITNDETAPTVLEVTSDVNNATFKVGDDINIYVQYSEEVFVTGTPQLELETGATDRTIDYVDRSSSTLRFVYSVQAGDVSSDLDVTSSSALTLNGGTIVDAVGLNADLAVQHGTEGGSLTSKDIVIDGVAPTITINSNASDPQSGPFTATFTFSENISGFDVGDISMGNGVASNFNTTSAKIYTALITPSADGEVTIDVAADVATDVAGNNNTAATQLSVSNDETTPSVTITSSADPTSGAFTATFTFSEDVSGFDISGITVGNGAASNFNTTTARIYTATITPTTDGVVTLNVANGAALDAAGNNNSAATQVSVTNDETAPTLVSATKDSDTQITLTFNEAVETLGANPTDFTVTDENSSTFTVQTVSDGTAGDTELILTFTDVSAAQLNLYINYANNNAVVTDLVGNELASTRGGVSISLNAVPTATNVDFSGILTVGETLTGSYTYSDSDNDAEDGTTFKWYRSDNASGTNKTAIAGAAASTYVLTGADANKYISFEVTPNDGLNAGTAVESNLQGEVNKISQTITFTALADKTYGDAAFDLAATASSNLTVTYASSNTNVATISGNTVTIVGAGTTTITASQAGDASYAAATSATQVLTVNKAVLTATAEDKSKTYGEANPAFTITYSGFVNGEDKTAITTEPTASTTADATTGVGTYDISLSGGVSTNYSFTTNKGTLTISKAVLSATADDKSKIYGESNPSFTIDYTGFVNGDDATAITTEPTASTTADETTGVGTYDIDLTGGAADNYSFNLTSGTLTVNKATLTVTADDKSRIYGKANPAFTSTYSGFVNGDDKTVITTEPTASTVADVTTGVGTYDIDLAGGLADNYSFNLTSGTLTIGKATLTATADDKNKVYGEVNPSFTVTYSGFVNGDDATAITTEPTASTTADATTGVGTYDISLSGGVSTNYSFTTNNGTLTIGKAVLTATADDKSKIYGESNPTFTITYTGFVNGDDATSITTEPTASTTADETTGVGTYDIDLTGGAADNYSFNLTSGTLTVYKATLTVTADDKLKGFSQVNPELTMTYTGFVNGDDVSDIDVEPGISTTADETTPAGTVSITLTGGSDDNYSLNLVDGTMTIVDASIITSVTVPADGTYKIGDKLEFTATFSLPITIAGVPIIPLTIGAEVKAAMLTGSVSNGSTATFSYTVVEGDLDIDGIALGTNIDLNGGTIVDGFGTDASLTLTNAGSAALVNVDGVRPSAPVVTSVSDDSGFDGADGVTFDQTLMISGTAEANILVEVFIDGTSIGTTASDANGDWIFDNTANTLEGGYYTITAKTTDSAGNISDASADYAVEIDVVAPAPPPAPTIDPVSDLGVSNSDNLTNDKTPTIIGTAEANAIIEITSDKDGLLGTTTADANGDWTFTPTSDLSEGSHEITVKATDAAGNQGGASDPLSKELDFTLELVSFSPADNAIDVLPGTDLTIDFGENVNKGTGNIIIKQSNDNTVLETIDVTSDKVSISGSVVTINPENAILPQATEFYVLLDAGTFTDDSGNAHAGISNNTDWTFTTIDATVVTSVGIPNDGTYGIGDDLAIELTFSQAVTFTGSPTIDLTIGTQTVAATLQGTVSASTTATFAYTVEEGDLDVDGINVGTTINLNGGTLKDAFDVDAITALVGIGSTVNVKVDGVRATPTLSTSAGDLTNAAFTVTVTYDEEVSGLSATDLEVSNGTVNSVNVVTAGLVWEAEIAPTADGTTTVSVLAGAVADNAGNTSVASTNLISTTFDGTAPEVSSIAKAEPDQIPTGTATRSFTVVFSEEVTGVDVTDFEVITTGTATASINAVTATDAKTYTVSVNGISGEGTIGLNAKDDGSIIDAATNSLADAFTGEVYTTNFAPTDITLSASSIQENNDVDEEVATLSTTDADAGDSFTYSLVSGTGDADNASFTINGDKLLAAEAFDFETKDSYSIRLKTDDGFGGSFEKELTINITNEGEAIIGIAGEGEFEQTTLGLSTTKTWTVTNSGDVATEVRIISSSQGFSFSPGSVQVEAGASQEITAVFSPSEAKVYSGVVVFNYDITDDMQDNVIEVNLSGEGVIVTGIDNGQISDEQIAVFPNPASSYVTIDLSELNGMPLDIRMVNSTGVSKLEKEGYDKPELRIDVTNFENGLYIIQFSNERSLVRKKVLIRK